jgi:Ca2+-binding RTX toxin-like protein
VTPRTAGVFCAATVKQHNAGAPASSIRETLLNGITRRLLALGVAAAGTIAIPAAAQAATLTNSGGTLTYTASAGTVSWVTFSQTATTVSVAVDPVAGDNDPITTSTCTPTGANSYDCANVAQVVADAADGNDGLFAGDLQIPVSFMGGDGIDYLYGADAADALAGGAGEDQVVGGGGADALSGGSGDDNLYTSDGADVVSGGSGVDSANVYYGGDATAGATSALPVSVTLDGVANDGVSGQGANIGNDVEDPSANSTFSPLTGPDQYGTTTVVGNGGANEVGGSSGADALAGAAGNDRFYAGDGADTIDARDGFADVLFCGEGADTAIVDTLDTVSDSCENVSTADVGNANEDKPPTVAWTAPASGAKLPGSKVATLTVGATDDKGVAKVVFMDDDTVVCTDTVAPYTCAYQANGTDLGHNTLTAVASDAAGQTASSVRPVVVTRFSAETLSLKVSPTKDKRASYSFTASGALTRSTTVSKTLNCTGSVKVSIKVGSKSLKTKTVRLSKSCSYKTTLSLPTRSGFPSNGKLKLRAVFAGNTTIAGKNSSTKTVSTK